MGKRAVAATEATFSSVSPTSRVLGELSLLARRPWGASVALRPCLAHIALGARVARRPWGADELVHVHVLHEAVIAWVKGSRVTTRYLIWKHFSTKETPHSYLLGSKCNGPKVPAKLVLA